MKYISAIMHLKYFYVDNGPKVVKIFINQPGSLDFDKADSMEPNQLLV